MSEFDLECEQMELGKKSKYFDKKKKKKLNFGPLEGLQGKWEGVGFNIIALPKFDPTKEPKPPGDFRLILNATSEVLEFTAISGAIPNRGGLVNAQDPTTRQKDINMYGLTYLQQVEDVESGEEIHVEPGIFLNIPSTKIPLQGETVVRMSNVPHGDSLLAQSTSIATFKDPNIFEANSYPSGPGVHIPGYLDPYLNPRLPNGIKQEMVKDPNLLLKLAIKEQNIIETTEIVLSTKPVGGIVNIPFIETNANVNKLDFTLWLEKVQNPDGSISEQLQYSQNAILNFHGIDWPHISVATLVKSI